MKKIVLVPLCIAAIGCVATHERPMNKGEKTIASDQVAMMVEENGGRLDTRDHDDVICDRIRTTGTHMVTRVCYTRAEKEALDRANQDEVRRRFGKQKCLATLSTACNSALEEIGGALGPDPGGSP